jgi:putative transposase
MIIIPEEAPSMIPVVSVPDTQGPDAMEVDDLMAHNSSKTRGCVVSIDPGVRTFATCYDPDGLVCKWGCAGPDGSPSANTKLWHIANQANSVRSRMKDPRLRTNKIGRGKKHRRRRHMRKVAARLELRIRNLVSELHHKLALWLCRNYETILLPSFRVSQMVRKKDSRGHKRKLGRRTVKEIYSLGHCRFREYLKYLAPRYDTLVCECDEAYTTQTCGACGVLNYVGGSETYQCKTCGSVFDRDENASRNIMLKFAQDNGIDL